MGMLRVLSVGAVLGLMSGDMPAQERAQPARAGISDIAWLAGEWTMVDTATTVEERWTEPAGGAMLAVSRTIAGNRMTEFEFLRIIQRDNGLVYVAQPGGRPPTEFVLTRLANQTATFENPAHDFPKMIQYALRANGRLEATVSDGGRKAQTFSFTRRR
jgi:hypothetical protein